MITRLERRDKAAVHHRVDESWKRWAYEETLVMPSCERKVIVSFTPCSRDRRSLPEIGNCWSVATLVLDGFVASGFLVARRGTISQLRLCEPELAGFDGLVVDIEEG